MRIINYRNIIDDKLCLNIYKIKVIGFYIESIYDNISNIVLFTKIHDKKYIIEFNNITKEIFIDKLSIKKYNELISDNILITITDNDFNICKTKKFTSNLLFLDENDDIILSNLLLEAELFNEKLSKIDFLEYFFGYKEISDEKIKESLT